MPSDHVTHDHAMDANRERRRILVGVDFSEHSNDALAEACRIAEANAAVELHVLHVVPPPIGDVGIYGAAPDFATELDTFIERGRNELGAVCAGIADELTPRVHQHIRAGTPARELVAAARDIDADLIVVGTHGRTGIQRVLLGSIAENVLRHAPCSVLTVRRKPPEPVIEEGCPDCKAARDATHDDHARCERHQHRLRPHTYHETHAGYPGPSFRF